jgi:small-conductance mechanosensitive channel
MQVRRLLVPGVLAGLLLVGAAGAPPDPAASDHSGKVGPPLTAASSETVVAPPQATADTAEAEGERAATLREVGDTARSFGLRALGAVLVLVLTFFLVKGVAFLLDTLSERNAERRLLYKRLIPIVRVVLWALALYVVLRGIFNVDAQGLLAAAAAIGVAIGFAAQDLLKNIFGGLVILFDQSFQAGDKIEVGGTYGEVTSIGLRSTRIVTPDDNLVTVPNAQVADSQVSNANAGELTCQVGTDLYLPGWVDEGRAREIAHQAAVSSSYVFLEKPIVVLVKDEYDEGHLVHLKVKAYVIDTRYEALLASDVTERARQAFRAEGWLPPTTRSYVDLPTRPDSDAPPASAMP